MINRLWLVVLVALFFSSPWYGWDWVPFKGKVPREKLEWASEK